MWSSGRSRDSGVSMSTHNTSCSTFSTHHDPNGTVSTTDVELNAVSPTAVVGRKNSAVRDFFVVGSKGKWNLPQKLDCLFQKTCILYSLILAGIWIMFTIPIIVFYATNTRVISVQNATSHQMPGNDTTRQIQNTTRNSEAGIRCSDDFYLDNSSGLCRPECGRWDQYSPATRSAVYGTNIAFVFLTILMCVTAFVWSIFRHKIMFRFPNIILVYTTVTRIVFSVVHLVGYVDEEALYCTSRDRVTSFEEGSPYCSIIGATLTFIPTNDLILLCFHLGTVLFTAYFSFHAREFESKGRYKYIHIAAVASGVINCGLLVGIQFALGGYSRTMVPIFCLADKSSSFVFGIIPICLISATFLTIVMLLLFKIFDIGQWKFKPEPTKTGNGESNSNPSHSYTTAQVKLILIFCAYALSNVVSYSAYSVVLRREDVYSEALEQYFDCESTGMAVGKTCYRSTFEEVDPTRVTFPLAIISYGLLPFATLIYVSNVEKLIKKLKNYITQ